MPGKKSAGFIYIRDVLARPPLFLLQSTQTCRICGEPNQVIVVGAAAIVIDHKLKEQPHLFYTVTEMADALTAGLAEHATFKTILSPKIGFPHYTNTCASCGAFLGDFNLLARPDDPLADESSIYDIDIEELTVAGPVELRAHVKRLPRAFQQLLMQQGILPDEKSSVEP